MTDAIPLVIDNGSYATVYGFGGDSEPISAIPSVVGRTRAQHNPDVYVGIQAITKPNLMLRYPIENRIITSFDDIEVLWNFIFQNELKTSPDKHPILMTLSPQNSEESRETVLQIMMETFKVPAFYLAMPSAMSLYAANVTNGIVVDAGDAGTQITPVFEGFSMPYFSAKLDIGGKHVNETLRRSLVQAGYTFSPRTERELMRDMKEQICYVAADASAEGNVSERIFLTPEGNEIKVGNQTYMSPEILFQPKLIGNDSPGTVQLIAEVINNLDKDIVNQMTSTILLAGGSTMFKGYSERITKDLKGEIGSIRYNVVAPSARKISAWVGGSIFSNVQTFKQLWVSKLEYEEFGASIIHVKTY